MLLLFYFQVLIVFAQDTSTLSSDAVATTPTQIEFKEHSPFLSCAMRRSMTGQVPAGGFFSRVPLKDQNGNKSREFLSALQKKIEGKIKENIEMSRQVTACFKPPYAETAENHCQDLRSWVDPKKYPSANNPAEESSLSYNIALARAHLAVANPNVSFQKAMQPNADLKPYGFKAIPWQPLTPVEAKNASSTLEKYKEQFRKNHSPDLPNGKTHPMSEEEFKSLLKTYDRQTLDGQIYANPMNVSEKETRHNILQSDLERAMTKVRNQHLDRYRAIVNRFPIINYLSSAHPNLQEIQDAGLRLQENAKKELADVQKVGQLLNHPRHADDVINNKSILNLMDYRSLVEDLLAEQPQFCAVATTTELYREKRELTNSLLITAPVLAVCFAPIAVPLALTIGLAAGAASAYSSYSQYQNEKQGAYAAPINNGLRANQSQVDSARTTYQSDLIMVPVNTLLGGAIGYGKGLLPGK